MLNIMVPMNSDVFNTRSQSISLEDFRILIVFFAFFSRETFSHYIWQLREKYVEF